MNSPLVDDSSPFSQPRLIECLRDYTISKFFADLGAGITVGIVALPLAMAFGIASGVKPEAGIFTAVIAGFLISALGGSRVQIGGPTGAFVVIVYGIIAKYGLQNLFICTMMAGVMLTVLGLSRLGSMIKFIPYPVTMGFTNGIAVLIFSTQIKDFFGLQINEVPADFIEKLQSLFSHLYTLQASTTLLACSSIAVILLWPTRWARRVPGSIVAIILGTLAVMILKLPVETLGTRFGGIPQGLPPLRIPDFSLSHLQELISPAITIALLAAIESLLSAVVADGLIDDRHNSNQELLAQGIANICSPLFGGIPATGAIARTATNIKNGAQTPIAGIIHAAVLLIIILVVAPLAKLIPLATLSAVLVIVAFNMGAWHEFRMLHRYPKSDASVFLITFGLTVIFNLTTAVEVGMILAALLFIGRVNATTQITAVDQSTETEGAQDSLLGKEVPSGVLIYRIFGAFLFGAADKLETALHRTGQEPEVLILRMRMVIAMDATALNALESLHEKLKNRGKHLVLSGPHTQPYMLMDRTGFFDRLGRENVCPHVEAALNRAREILELSPAPP
jgi:SulP family sulfate permease